MRLPKSIRIRIYDAVKAGVDEKGCWTASEDGFEGRKLPGKKEISCRIW